MTPLSPSSAGEATRSPGPEGMPQRYSMLLCGMPCILSPHFDQEEGANMRKPYLYLAVVIIGAILYFTLSSYKPAENVQATTFTAVIHATRIPTASSRLARISQLDPSQYNSASDYNLWALSACSSAVMTEVINAYGHHYRIADILKVEAALDEITPRLGLVEDVGVARTMTKFGFKTSWEYSLSYDQVVATANRGEPVIVSWPPARYKGGHLVVVIGGNSQTILIADSSRYDHHSLSRAQFLAWWAGFSAVITPA